MFYQIANMFFNCKYVYLIYQFERSGIRRGFLWWYFKFEIPISYFKTNLNMWNIKLQICFIKLQICFSNCKYVYQIYKFERSGIRRGFLWWYFKCVIWDMVAFLMFLLALPFLPLVLVLLPPLASALGVYCLFAGPPLFASGEVFLRLKPWPWQGLIV